MREFDFIEVIQKTFLDVVKISFFGSMKTGIPILDALGTTLIFTLMSYLLKVFYENQYLYKINYSIVYDQIKSLFVKKHSIIFEGKRCSSVGSYNQFPVVSSCFTDSFKAIWDDITNNLNKNKTIYELQELYTHMDLFQENYKEKKENSDIYIVSQKTPFLYNSDLKIYAIADYSTEDSNDDKNKQTTKIDKITLTLYSYHTDISGIKNIINKIKNNYIQALEKQRNNKKFIYTLTKTKYEELKYECWSEYPFDSTRTFDNIFFENKKYIVEKINFFLENKSWYYEMGIPYSLGIGLHGPPGTGKTSFFKCLANMTGRHLIILSLKLIKTRRQLEDFFFEDRYNSNNKVHDVGFDKKIIIIEDIDCLGEIIWKRSTAAEITRVALNDLRVSSKVNVSDIVQSFMESTNEQNKLVKEDDPITLDDILNLWDGLKETPGRILGISSNHYERLDPALTRPGRIDITLKLDNASHDIIRDMFNKYYKKNIDEIKLKKIKNYFYSPAEIINFYMMHKNNPFEFMKQLAKNKHI